MWRITILLYSPLHYSLPFYSPQVAGLLSLHGCFALGLKLIFLDFPIPEHGQGESEKTSGTLFNSLPLAFLALSSQ